MMSVGETARSRCNRGPFIVGRGPVPRYGSRTPTLAGACPPRYGKKTVLEPTRGTGPRATAKKRRALP